MHNRRGSGFIQAHSLLSLAVMVGLCTTAAKGGDAQSKQPLDLLITGGTVIDGTAGERIKADVGIRGGRIVLVGDANSAKAIRTINAEGKIVVPGFIDLHSHAGPGLASNDSRRWGAPNLVTQGITTVVLNPDGGGPVSVTEQRRQLQNRRIGPNAILMVGHNSIRRAVLKNNFRRPATPAEIGHMCRLVKEGMQAGAFGLTAGLEYVPGIWSTTEEVVALVHEIVPAGGAFIVHERASGADPMWYLPSQHGPNPSSMIDNIAELIDVAERTGATVVATHIKARGAEFWGSSEKIIGMIERARARGLKLYADQYPYNTSGSDGRLVLIPAWVRQPTTRSSKQNGNDKQTDFAAQLQTVLRDAERAADLRKDIAHEIVRRGGPESIVVMDYPDRTAVGKTLADLSNSAGVEPVEMAIKLQLEGFHTRPGGARVRGYSMSELDVEAFARQSWTATASDAGIALPEDGPVHARFYGTFPRKIRHYAMTRGVFSVDEAVRSATGLPAEILGLPDRGLVRVGYHADLVVLDLQRIRDKATFVDPHRNCEGVELVLVGGVAVVENGRTTGALPGTVITR